MKQIIYRFLLSTFIKYVFFYTAIFYSAKMPSRWLKGLTYDFLKESLVGLAFLLPLPLIEIVIFIVPYSFLFYQLQTKAHALYFIGLIVLQPLNIAYLVFMTSSNDREMILSYFLLNVLTLVIFFGKILFRIKQAK